MGDTKAIWIEPGYPNNVVPIAVGLPLELEASLMEFLFGNTDVIAWKTLDMPCIPHEVAGHYLCIKLDANSVQQWLRCFDKDKRKPIRVSSLGSWP